MLSIDDVRMVCHEDQSAPRSSLVRDGLSDFQSQSDERAGFADDDLQVRATGLGNAPQSDAEGAPGSAISS